MIRVSKVASSGEAGKYYTDAAEKNYYTDGPATSQWWGDGADRLGLSGQVDRATFERALDGRKEIFGQQVGNSPERVQQLREQWQEKVKAWEAGGKVGPAPKEPPGRLGGIDLTFNAPKDASLLAAHGYGGDARVLYAHERAVTATLEKIQADITSRINKEPVATGNIIVARFNEDTTRPVLRANGQAIPDPHIHTHAVFINATQGPDGKWRSVDTRPFFENFNDQYRRDATQYYWNQYAHEMRLLGFDVERTKDGSFQVKGIDREDVKAASSRKSEIDAKLAEKGLTRETATAQQKVTANKQSRLTKSQGADVPATHRAWEQMGAAGRTDWSQVVGQARNRSGADQVRDQATGKPMSEIGATAEHRAKVEDQARDQARSAVVYAAAHHAEREAAFSEKDLLRTAAEHARGRATEGHLRAAVIEAKASGALEERTVRTYHPEHGDWRETQGLTTREAIAAERQMLSIERQGRGAVAPAMTTHEARSAVSAAVTTAQARGHQWNDGQRAATVGLLTSSNRVVAVQGYAGTAKTNATLATYAKEMQARGYEVKALAPTASAAGTLGTAIGAKGATVDKHLAQLRTEERQGFKAQQQAGQKIGRTADRAAGGWTTPDGKHLSKGLDGRFHGDPINGLLRDAGALAARAKDILDGGSKQPGHAGQVWIVDEASMLGAQKMAELQGRAEKAGARVVLVGDVKQLGSVEAGRAFGQMQDAGMKTHVLDQIVRQENAQLRQAVYHSIQGEMRDAFRQLDKGGGKVVEIGADVKDRAEHRKAAEDRRAAIVKDYLRLSPAERDRTLVIDPSRDGRQALNEAIRAGMQKEGTLHGVQLRAETLENRYLTKAQATEARSYKAGDEVKFGRTYESRGVQAGEYLRVKATDRETGRITLEKHDGRAVEWNPKQWGGRDVSAFRVQERGIQAGDRIQWTRNDDAHGRRNAEEARVTKVDAARGVALVTLRDGTRQELDLSKRDHQHWDHAYVKTAHAAQGQTADRAYVHMESWRQQLSNAKSFYVGISRAVQEARVYTDNRARLMEGVATRTGEKQAAMDKTPPQAGRNQAAPRPYTSTVARQVAARPASSQQQAKPLRIDRQAAGRAITRQSQPRQAQAQTKVPAIRTAQQAKPQAQQRAAIRPAARTTPARTIAIRTAGQSRPAPTRSPATGKGSVFGRAMTSAARELHSGIQGGRTVERDVHNAMDRLQRTIERMGDRAMSAAVQKIGQGIAAAGRAAGRVAQAGFTRMVQGRGPDRGESRMKGAEHKADGLLSRASQKSMAQDKGMSRDGGRTR